MSTQINDSDYPKIITSFTVKELRALGYAVDFTIRNLESMITDLGWMASEKAAKKYKATVETLKRLTPRFETYK